MRAFTLAGIVNSDQLHYDNNQSGEYLFCELSQ